MNKQKKIILLGLLIFSQACKPVEMQTYKSSIGGTVHPVDVDGDGIASFPRAQYSEIDLWLQDLPLGSGLFDSMMLLPLQVTKAGGMVFITGSILGVVDTVKSGILSASVTSYPLPGSLWPHKELDFGMTFEGGPGNLFEIVTGHVSTDGVMTFRFRSAEDFQEDNREIYFKFSYAYVPASMERITKEFE